MPAARLDDRGVIEVRGAEARAYLDRLVTCEVETLAEGGARYGALLTPQGKIIADFVALLPEPDRFLLDLPREGVPELLKRLALYRLRAKVAIVDRSAELAVMAGWDGAAPPADAVASAADPRLGELGWRAVVSGAAGGEDATAAGYHAHRIRLGIPEVGRDLPLGDAFPHEALMDQLAGVDFRKGCYVGQEVVSRMQHRGTARTRVVGLRYADEGSHPAGEVTAGDRTIGRAGPALDGFALAPIRIDRAGEALAANEPILASGRPVGFVKPPWARFAYPGEGAVVPA